MEEKKNWVKDFLGRHAQLVASAMYYREVDPIKKEEELEKELQQKLDRAKETRFTKKELDHIENKLSLDWSGNITTLKILEKIKSKLTTK